MNGHPVPHLAQRVHIHEGDDENFARDVQLEELKQLENSAAPQIASLAAPQIASPAAPPAVHSASPSETGSNERKEFKQQSPPGTEKKQLDDEHKHEQKEGKEREVKE